MYTIVVTGAVDGETISAVIGAGAVTDIAGNTNLASTSTDNFITYQAPMTFDPDQNDAPQNETTTSENSGVLAETGVNLSLFTLLSGLLVTIGARMIRKNT